MQENQAADFYLHDDLTDPISFLVCLILLAIEPERICTVGCAV